MPIAMTREQQALQVSLRDWAKRADTIAVVRAQGDPAALMADLLAGGGTDPEFTERTGFHVAAGYAVARLGERGAHPAVRKLLGTGHRQAVAETALDLLGPAGGTTQILLNQIAERVLGLPR